MTDSGAGHLPKVICETLDSVVAPEVRDRVLMAALHASALEAVPVSPVEFRDFLQGPLFLTLMRELGEDLGRSVMSELGSIVATAERDVEARSSRTRGHRSTMPSVPDIGIAPYEADVTSPYPKDFTPDGRDFASDANDFAPDTVAHPVATLDDELTSEVIGAEDLVARYDTLPPVAARPAPASSSYPLGLADALSVIGTASVGVSSSKVMPIVLLASSDPNLVRCFAAWLDPRATVQPVSNVLAILHEVNGSEGRRVVVLYDARSPSIRAIALAALAEDLPDSARVVLWGVSSETYSQMLGVSANVAKWLSCGTDFTTHDVVAQCARMVG
jgi:hypothetical protein